MPSTTSTILYASNENGSPLLPYLLCQDVIANNGIKLTWEGTATVVEFTHYDVDGNILNNEIISR
ncbi:hypothetical protein [Arenibacter sp. S6351L]|uniref:hypothetical protein n=1 Tax=Arenibacter sp. S6351L TaxID=2926407 RepID=UPI001FF3C4A1|nr:hypothetical protein [Arenibacter sp. S6351L]MCK0135072.1 hypothetical protein [Arenibacter sp. S6351L]